MHKSAFLRWWCGSILAVVLRFGYGFLLSFDQMNAMENLQRGRLAVIADDAIGGTKTAGIFSSPAVSFSCTVF